MMWICSNKLQSTFRHIFKILLIKFAIKYLNHMAASSHFRWIDRKALVGELWEEKIELQLIVAYQGFRVAD